MGLGVALALLATVGWGIGDVMARRAMFHAPPGLVLIVATVLVIVALGVLGVLAHGPGAFTDLPPVFFGLVALMGVFAYVTGQLFYLMGIRRAGLVVAAPIIGTTPLFAVALAVVLGGERPGVATLVGASIVVAGVIVILTDRNRARR